HVAPLHQLAHQLLVARRADGVAESRPADEMGEVLDRAGGQVIEDRDLMTTVEKRLGEVRSDESCAARDECTHQISSRISLSNARSQYGDGAPFAPIAWAPDSYGETIVTWRHRSGRRNAVQDQKSCGSQTFCCGRSGEVVL